MADALSSHIRKIQLRDQLKDRQRLKDGGGEGDDPDQGAPHVFAPFRARKWPLNSPVAIRNTVSGTGDRRDNSPSWK